MRNHSMGYRALVALIAAAAVAGCSTWPSGQEGPASTVVGRGDPAVDVAAVQQAVDRGGTVLLKGQFDFGEKGHVRLTRDVMLVGEADASGKPVTTIKGGHATVRSRLPEAAGGAGPKIAIKQIHFDGATWVPMQFTYTSGVTVTANRVTRVKPLAFPPHAVISRGQPYNMQAGVMVGGEDPDRKQLPYRADSATGSISITDNDFDMANEVPRATIGIGIFVIGATGIEADIARNRIRNASRNSIEVAENYRGADGRGRVVIRDNDIETPTDGAPMPNPRTPNGILFGYFLDPHAAADERRAMPYLVTGNKVRVRGQTAGSWGLAVMANRTTVSDNQLILDAPGAMGIGVTGSNNIIERNRFEGSGTLGVVFAPIPPMKASDNQIVANDLSRVKTSRGEFALIKGANRNRIVGSTGSVADAGEGNVTEGLKPFVQASK